ncbi:hypothetical protein E2C01_011457 [Portunus trituberculatus]|uniref:Uncharacterized protein n=1 Tax=Portunus trituberculatus TaxID=210409 RepID=A0A5B7DBG5_PORTR|nr:hypothetical protein [Portunus trituberculatus]
MGGSVDFIRLGGFKRFVRWKIENTGCSFPSVQLVSTLDVQKEILWQVGSSKSLPGPTEEQQDYYRKKSTKGTTKNILVSQFES